MGLRAQDPMPNWISHLAVVNDTQVLTGLKDQFRALAKAKKAPVIRQGSEQLQIHAHLQQKADRNVLVELKNVSVSYHERKVIDSVFLP
jgi:ABC-type molybdenum transport system ATPase subunit/photorepair protein PhrA